MGAMIKDDKQLAYTKELAAKFEEANRKLKANEVHRRLDPAGWQLIQDSNQALRQKLISEVEEYEALEAHHPTQPLILEIDDINYLPDTIIKARIALKLTQHELAILSDHTEEEIRAFEEKNYHNASFLDFLAVSNALGIKIDSGKFIAHLDDFYQQELMDIRSQVTSHTNLNPIRI
jgi:hypothetical protein